MDTSLDDRLVAQDKPPLGWQQRVVIILFVCRALKYLHSQGLVHRDIKGGNILLNGYGSNVADNSSIAKVADFGTAREDGDKYRDDDGNYRTSAKTHASTKQIVGTSPYMPPEYVRDGHVSEKTDAFALGILVRYSSQTVIAAVVLCL